MQILIYIFLTYFFISVLPSFIINAIVNTRPIFNARDLVLLTFLPYVIHSLLNNPKNLK